ncbi:hypothetical protein BD770DRAFT_477350 [Pilaira anomala]|nr:hypothetical protein BD770DRAFT_477350 [Pilaira anomala]
MDNNNNSGRTSVINFRASSNKQPIVCPWCSDSITTAVTLNTFRRHVDRKHPDKKQSAFFQSLFNWSASRRSNPSSSTVINEPMDTDSVSSLQNTSLQMQHFDPDAEVDPIQEYSSDEDFSNYISDNKVYSSEEEKDDTDSTTGTSYHIDEGYLLNTILPMVQSFDRNSTTTTPSVSGITQEPIFATSRMEQEEVLPTTANPFVSPVEALIHGFFYGDEDLCSERMIKKIRYLLKCALKLQQDSHSKLVLPKADRIFNMHQRLKSKVPVFEAEEHTAKNKQKQTHSFFMLPPSKYMMRLAATPGMIDEMAALPDFTPDRCLDLKHGDKWKYNPHFQAPMVTRGSHDFWVGDLVKDTHDGYWLLKKFFWKEDVQAISGTDEKKKVTFALAYPVFNFAVCSSTLLLPLDDIACGVSKAPNFQGNGYTFQFNPQGEFMPMYHGLEGDIARLWSGTDFASRFKRILPSSSPINPKFMKVVVVAPVVLWSDDTSGNKSKQYNVFDSYLIYLGATPMERRTRRENAMFICTSDKNLQAVDMLGAIVEDLSKLKRVFEVYSHDHKEYILLVAPLLMLTADNPRHSQLAMHKGTSSKSPCRKCLRPKATDMASISVTDPTTGRKYVSHDGEPRSIEMLYEVLRCQEHDDRRYKMLVDKFSFTVNGSEVFLKLEAFDPTLDCPTEVLHTVPLGCIKYLVDFLVKRVMTQSEKDSLDTAVARCRNKDAYSRTFRNNLRHCGSFVGRDYKCNGGISLSELNNNKYL